VAGSCEHGKEYLGSVKQLISRPAERLVNNLLVNILLHPERLSPP